MTQAIYQTAQKHHLAGRLDEAQNLYRQILSREPDHIDSLHLLGVTELQQGKAAAAEELIGRAIQADPNRADFHGNMGLVYSTLGRRDEAISEFELALKLRPNYPEAHNNLGIELANRRDYDEAIAAYRAAISLRPNFADALSNLGSALLDKGNHEEAVAAINKALAINPNFAQAHNNLGNALREMGRMEEAIASLSRAIELQPLLPSAHSNLGCIFHARGNLPAAIAEFKRAIELQPTYSGAWSNLAAALVDNNEYDQALEAGKKAVEFGPDSLHAQNNLANVLKDAGELDQALKHLAKAVEIAPNSAVAHSNRIFCMHFHPGYDAAALLEECREWDRRHAQPLRKDIPPHTNDRESERQLKIGYVSPDFYNQAEAHYVVPLLQSHLPEHFEVHCYSAVARPDATTERLRRSAHSWHDILHLSDEQAAQKIRDDKIDILIDLTMHMRNNRLPIFARKPAPIQVTWLAYPGGTGVGTIDYRFTDPFIDPEPDPEPAVYSEKSIRLTSYWGCYDPLISMPPSPPRRDGPIVFGSLNNPLKLNEKTLRLWAEVLRAVPASRLLVLAYAQPHRQSIARLMNECGVEESRIEFVGRTSRPEYLRTYHRIDLCLDALPYNGSTTACDSLWMGVPMVTLVGNTGCGRVGMSTMCNVGLEELVARTPEEFVKIAADWAGDLKRLAHWRGALRNQMMNSPIMDRKLFVDSVEAAYRRMWRAWCKAR
jgi:protein O-GlcNAc transferase